MKKIVALAFGICLMGGVVGAQTLDSKYGLDSVKTLENASIYSEFLKQKIIRKLCLPGGMFLITLPSFRCLLIPKGKIC